MPRKTEKKYDSLTSEIQARLAVRDGKLIWAIGNWMVKTGSEVRTASTYIHGHAFRKDELIAFLSEGDPLPEGRQMDYQSYGEFRKKATAINKQLERFPELVPQKSTSVGGGLTTNQDGILMDAHHMIAELHGKVDSLTKDLDDLKASNERLEAMMVSFMGKFK